LGKIGRPWNIFSSLKEKMPFSFGILTFYVSVKSAKYIFNSLEFPNIEPLTLPYWL